MPEVLTVALTVIVGVLVFVIGQIIVRFVVDPIHEQRLQIGLIADALIFYADVYSNPGADMHSEERLTKARADLRSRASQLMAKSNAIPCYGLWSFIRLIPRWESVVRSRGHLIRLSNSLVRGDPIHNTKEREAIHDLLGIRTE